MPLQLLPLVNKRLTLYIIDMVFEMHYDHYLLLQYMYDVQ